MVATMAEEEAAAAAAAAEEAPQEGAAAPEEEEEAQEQESSEPKSLKDTVSVNNEWTEVEPEPVVIDATQDDTVDDKHPIQKHMDAVVKNVQGVMDDLGKNTQKTLDELGKNTKGLMDNVGKSTKDVMNNMGKNTKGALETTKGAMDTHVAPHIENVRRSSVKALDDLGKNTNKALEEHVVPHIENVKQVSVRAIDSTKLALDEHVAPHVENVKRASVRALDDLGKGTVSKFETIKGYNGYYMGTAPSVKEMCASDWKLQLLEGTFRAFGQVVFMSNPVSGLFVWIAMLVAFPLAALCALLCVLAANLTSLGLELDASTMASGLYGYNAVLVGAGVATLLDCAVWRMIVLVIFVAAPLTIVTYLFFFYKYNILPLQLPYNGVMILLLLSAMYLDALAVDAVVMSGWAFGVLLVIAIVLYSRILAGVALVASLLAAILLPMETGMGAYNVVFTLAFFVTQCVPSFKTLLLALLAIVLTGVVQTALAELLGYVHLPVLTLPFCLVVFPFLALGSNADLLLIPADELSTPEEHLKKYLFPKDDEDGEELVLKEEADLETGVAATEESPLLPK